MSKKTWIISLTAATAMGALACGDETTDTGGDASVNTYDGGTFDGGAAGACTTTQFGTGAACTVDGGAGIQLCTNNVPSGPCQSTASLIAMFLGDGGITGLGGEGGILSNIDAAAFLGDSAISIGDGGIMFGDATIMLEAGTIKCPTGTSCSNLSSQVGLPVSYCTEMGQALPPTGCTENTKCMVGTAQGMCTKLPILGDLLGPTCLILCN